MLQLPIGKRQLWLRIGTMAALAICAIFLNLELILAPDRGVSLLGRVAGAGGVVASCGTLALMVMSRLHRQSASINGAGDAANGLKEIMLFCPACGKKQTLSLGYAECGKCGLIIQMTVQRKAINGQNA